MLFAIISSLLLLASPVLAEDCIDYYSSTNGTTQVCVGDEVYYIGTLSKQKNTVKAFFRSDRKSPVLLNKSRVALEDIAMTRGCIDGICVGDTIYQAGYLGYWKNTVIAINPYLDQPIIVNAKFDFAAPTKELYITFGCFKGFCVGDTVYIGPRSKSLKVAAINPFETKSIVLESGWGYRPDELALNQKLLSSYADLTSDIRNLNGFDYSLKDLQILRETFEKPITTEVFEY